MTQQSRPHDALLQHHRPNTIVLTKPQPPAVTGLLQPPPLWQFPCRQRSRRHAVFFLGAIPGPPTPTMREFSSTNLRNPLLAIPCFTGRPSVAPSSCLHVVVGHLDVVPAASSPAKSTRHSSI